MPTPARARFTELEAYATSQGLSDDAAWAYAVLGWWSEHFVPVAPKILSGRRSPFHNRQLQERWDRGDRAGLTARPADNSNHLRGEAWDIESGRALDIMAQLAPYVGVRWGGTFGKPDRNHFDLGAP